METNTNLEDFGYRHFDYINQIFGTSAIREVIQTEYPQTHDWILKSEETGAEFEYSHHHFCGKDCGETWCSVEVGLQDIDIYPNDTLCQSYSLMKYFGYIRETDTELTKDLQKRMVLMYKDLLKNNAIKQEIELQSPDENVWNYHIEDDVEKYKLRHNNYIYTDDETWVRKKGAEGKKNKILALIKTVLNQWDEYGWKHFMLSKSGGFRRSERIMKRQKTFKKTYKKKTIRSCKK